MKAIGAVILWLWFYGTVAASVEMKDAGEGLMRIFWAALWPIDACGNLGASWGKDCARKSLAGQAERGQ